MITKLQICGNGRPVLCILPRYDTSSTVGHEFYVKLENFSEKRIFGAQSNTFDNRLQSLTITRHQDDVLSLYSRLCSACRAPFEGGVFSLLSMVLSQS